MATILKFGKYKGQELEKTPKNYQEWLLRQEWFKLPTKQPLHHQLKGWNGHNRKGQAIYDAIFEQEKQQALKEDCRLGICTCCPDSPYYGL